MASMPFKVKVFGSGRIYRRKCDKIDCKTMRKINISFLNGLDAGRIDFMGEWGLF